MEVYVRGRVHEQQALPIQTNYTKLIKYLEKLLDAGFQGWSYLFRSPNNLRNGYTFYRAVKIAKRFINVARIPVPVPNFKGLKSR